MPRYKVIGFDQNTKENIEFSVEAPNMALARTNAKFRLGLITNGSAVSVKSVTRIDEIVGTYYN